MARKRTANSSESGAGFEQRITYNKKKCIAANQKRLVQTKIYKCPNCSKCIRNEKLYWIHLRSHLQYHPQECNVCLECFSQKKLLSAHKETHTKTKSFSCSECSKAFTHVSALNRHQLSHWEKSPFPCPICGEMFSTIAVRSRHVKNHIVSCSLCRVDFQDFTELITHIASKHRSKSADNGKGHGPGYIIPIEPDKVADLERDSSASCLKKVSKDYTCFVCEQSFSSQQSMATHVRAHRLFICSHCPQFFDNLISLRYHEYNHTGNHPFKCDTCLDFLGRSAKHLARHQKNCKHGEELHVIINTISNAADISSDVKAKVESAIKSVLSKNAVNKGPFQSEATHSVLQKIDPRAVACVSPESTSLRQREMLTLQKALVLLASDLDNSNTPSIDFTNLFHSYWVIRLLEDIKPDSYPLLADKFTKINHINSCLIDQMEKLTSQAAITKENLIFLNCIQKKVSIILGFHFDSLVEALS